MQLKSNMKAKVIFVYEVKDHNINKVVVKKTLLGDPTEQNTA